MNPEIVYELQIHQLHREYVNQETLEATCLNTYESLLPFGSFHVGDTISDGPGLIYLGRVQHVHHMVGEVKVGLFKHATAVYFYADR